MLSIADRGGISETQVLFLKEILNGENLSIYVTYHIPRHNVTHGSAYRIPDEASSHRGT
jgi:hypothetical protein